MVSNKDILDKGLVSALELASRTSWTEITLSDIANEAGVELSDFHQVASKDVLIDWATHFFDRAMSAEEVDRSDAPKERLFEVIMLRFEAMERHRAGLLSMMRYQDKSPARTAELLKSRHASGRWALVAAGLDNDDSQTMALKILGTAWVIRKTEHAWRKDTAGDFARTMATLDKELRAADSRMGWVKRFGYRSGTGSAAPSGAAGSTTPGDEVDT